MCIIFSTQLRLTADNSTKNTVICNTLYEIWCIQRLLAIHWQTEHMKQCPYSRRRDQTQILSFPAPSWAASNRILAVSWGRWFFSFAQHQWSAVSSPSSGASWCWPESASSGVLCPPRWFMHWSIFHVRKDRELELWSLEKKRFRRNLIDVYKYLTRADEENGARLLSSVHWQDKRQLTQIILYEVPSEYSKTLLFCECSDTVWSQEVPSNLDDFLLIT